MNREITNEDELRWKVEDLTRERDDATRRGDGLAADLATCVRLRDQALAEVERLREGLEEIVGEPWLMGGKDACTIASDTLAVPSHATEEQL